MNPLIAMGAGLLALAMVLTVTPLAGRSSAAAATQTVSIEDDMFVSKATTIAAGDTVQWNWVGQHDHSVTADDGSFDSTIRNGGPSFTRTFNTPGTYAYYCMVHGAPGGIAMSGTVVVQAAATATSTIAPTNTAVPTDTPEPTSAAATSTPVTATETATTATESPASTVTPVPVVSVATAPAPALGVAPAPATGGAAGSSALPRAGDGSATGTSPLRWMSIVLGALGTVALASSVVLRRHRG